MSKMPNTEEVRNSDYWSNIYMMVSGCEIIDPDGWDRKKYEFSWFEEQITWDEFQSRAMKSTQWTLPLNKRYEKIFSFIKQIRSQALAEGERIGREKEQTLRYKRIESLIIKMKKYTPRGLQEEGFDELLDMAEGNYNQALSDLLEALKETATKPEERTE